MITPTSPPFLVDTGLTIYQMLSPSGAPVGIKIVDTAEGARTTIRSLKLTDEQPPRLLYADDADADTSLDVSHDPSMGVGLMTRGLVAEDLHNQMLEELTAGHQGPEGDATDGRSPASRLLMQLFPLLGQAALHQGLMVPDRLCAANTDLLRHDTLQSALEQVHDARQITRPVLRAVASALVGHGSLNDAVLSFVRAAAGLPADMIAHVIENITPQAAGSQPPPARLADAAATILGRRNGTISAQQHRDVLFRIGQESHAGRIIGVVGAAASTGRYHDQGLRGANVADWVMRRAAEAADLAAHSTGIGKIAGVPVAGEGPPMRLRVLDRDVRDEFTYAGEQLDNCLGQWAPGGPYYWQLEDADAIVVVVGEDGRHHAAIHLRDRRIESIKGPDNDPVPGALRRRVEATLTATGYLSR